METTHFGLTSILAEGMLGILEIFQGVGEIPWIIRTVRFQIIETKFKAMRNPSDPNEDHSRFQLNVHGSRRDSREPRDSMNYRF